MVKEDSNAGGPEALHKCWAWCGRGGAAVCPSRELASLGVRVLTMTKVVLQCVRDRAGLDVCVGGGWVGGWVVWVVWVVQMM